MCGVKAQALPVFTLRMHIVENTIKTPHQPLTTVWLVLIIFLRLVCCRSESQRLCYDHVLNLSRSPAIYVLLLKIYDHEHKPCPPYSLTTPLGGLIQKCFLRACYMRGEIWDRHFGVWPCTSKYCIRRCTSKFYITTCIKVFFLISSLMHFVHYVRTSRMGKTWLTVFIRQVSSHVVPFLHCTPTVYMHDMPVYQK